VCLRDLVGGGPGVPVVQTLKRSIGYSPIDAQLQSLGLTTRPAIIRTDLVVLRRARSWRRGVRHRTGVLRSRQVKKIFCV